MNEGRIFPQDRAVVVRTASPMDADEICSIYNYYVEHTSVSFEERAVRSEEMAERIKHITASFPWLVCSEEGRMAGFAFAHLWKARSAYGKTLESSVYIRPDAFRRGLGSRLYSELLPPLKSQGCHAVIACIALPNAASVALHEKFGFRKVSHFREVGTKFGKWIDIGDWELLFDSSRGEP